jgi:hypothetical protein
LNSSFTRIYSKCSIKTYPKKNIFFGLEKKELKLDFWGVVISRSPRFCVLATFDHKIKDDTKFYMLMIDIYKSST